MTAAVAGGSSDLGRTIAVELARLGHDAVLWGRDGDRLEEAAAAVRAAGPAARVDAFDVRDRVALDDACARIPSLDVLVWCAGVFDFGPFDAADPEVVEEVLDTGLVTAARALRRLLPALIASRGHVVLIGSGADRRAFPDNAAYVAAKHGLRGLADAVRLDVRERGVRVTLVSPGPVAAGGGLRAPLPRERLLLPEGVAAAVRFALTFPGPGCPLHIDLDADA